MAPKRASSSAAAASPAAKRSKAEPSKSDGNVPLAALLQDEGDGTPPQKSKKARRGQDAPTPTTRERNRSTFITDFSKRRRSGEEELLEDAIIGYIDTGEADPPQGGQTQCRQSKDITDLEKLAGDADVPIAKSKRHLYVWVAEGPEGKFTANPENMVPLPKNCFHEKKDNSCDVCGIACTGVLHAFRCYARRKKEDIVATGARRLHPFVAYISLECGKGLLSRPTEIAKLREDIYTKVLSGEAAGLDEKALKSILWQLGNREKQVLMEELQFHANATDGESDRRRELRALESFHGALQQNVTDPFRATASGMGANSPAFGSRDLAMTAIFKAERNGFNADHLPPGWKFLRSVKVAIDAGIPMPDSPHKIDREEVLECLRLISKAWPMVQIRLKDSLNGEDVFPPESEKHKVKFVITMHYLPGCKELHAAIVGSSEDAAHKIQKIRRKSSDFIKEARQHYTASGAERKVVVSRTMSKAQDRQIVVPPSDTDVKMEDVRHILENIAWPRCFSRPNVKPEDVPYIEAFPLGMVLNYMSGLCLSHTLTLWPNLTKMLTRLIRQAHPDFKYTTIQLNRDYAAKMHVDGNNFGPSFIIAVGNYQGGMLWIYDKDGDHEMEVPNALRGYPDLKAGDKVKGKLVDVQNKWVKFNGNIPHCAMPFSGSRISLVYFTRSGFNNLKEETRAALEVRGFPVPDASAAGERQHIEVTTMGEEVLVNDEEHDEDEFDEDGLVDMAMKQDEQSSTWTARDWALDFKDKLGVSWIPSMAMEEMPPIKLFVCNSASVAPMAALEDLLPLGSAVLSGVSQGTRKRARYVRNFKPEHIYEWESEVVKGASMCFTCHKICELPKLEAHTPDEDIFVASFCGMPFVGREKVKGRNLCDDPRAAMLLSIHRHIATRHPLVAIVEMTDFEAVPSSQRGPLMAFVLEGRDQKTMHKFGLKLLDHYGVDFVDMELPNFGVPVKETRVHFVLVHKSAGGQEAAKRICNMVGQLQGLLPAVCADELIFDSEDARLEQVYNTEWLPKTKKDQQRFAEGAMLRGVTAKLKEMKRNAPPAGRLYAEAEEHASSGKWFPHATEEQRMQLNIAYEHARQSGLDVENLIVDLGQMASATATFQPWRDDGLLPARSAFQGARVLYSCKHKRPLTAQEELLCYGMPVWRLGFQGMTDAQVAELADGIMAVPAIGATLCATLALAELGEKRTLLKGMQYTIEKLVSQAPPRTGLAYDALHSFEVAVEKQRGGSEIQVRAAALLSLLRQEAGPVEALPAESQAATSALMKTLKLSTKAEAEMPLLPVAQEAEKEDPDSMVIRSKSGDEEPRDWSIRIRKIKYANPGEWPYAAFLRWVKEACEDPKAKGAYEIMYFGVQKLKPQLATKEATDEQLQEADKLIAELREAAQGQIADSLEEVVMSETYRRKEQAGDKSAVLDADMDESEVEAFVNNLVARCSRSGWLPRRWLLDHVAGAYEDEDKHEVLSCFAVKGGWDQIVPWLEDCPKPKDAEWALAKNTLSLLAKEAARSCEALLPSIHLAAETREQEVVMNECRASMLSYFNKVASGLATKAEEEMVREFRIVRRFSRVRGDLRGQLQAYRDGLLEVRRVLLEEITGMALSELEAQRRELSKKLVADPPEKGFEALHATMKEQGKQALRKLEQAIKVRKAETAREQQREQAKRTEAELRQYTTATGQLDALKVKSKDAFTMLVTRVTHFQKALQDVATPEQRNLLKSLKEGLKARGELPARQQATKRYLREHGFEGCIAFLEHKGLLNLVDLLAKGRKDEWPEALNPIREKLMNHLVSHEAEIKALQEAPVQLPRGWSQAKSRHNDMYYYYPNTGVRAAQQAAQFECPVEDE